MVWRSFSLLEKTFRTPENTSQKPSAKHLPYPSFDIRTQVLTHSRIYRGELMTMGDRTIKIYRRIGKKRYLDGKYTYEYERIYVPIPSRLHDIVKPFLNRHLKIGITRKNGGLTIVLHPAKTFRHAE